MGGNLAAHLAMDSVGPAQIQEKIQVTFLIGERFIRLFQRILSLSLLQIRQPVLSWESHPILPRVSEMSRAVPDRVSDKNGRKSHRKTQGGHGNFVLD